MAAIITFKLNRPIVQRAPRHVASAPIGFTEGCIYCGHAEASHSRIGMPSEPIDRCSECRGYDHVYRA